MTQTKSLNRAKSALLSRRIAEVIPGGVDSPFRSFNEVGGETIFFQQARGSRLIDVDGNEYIDYLGAWGPAILGHSHPEIVSACQAAVELVNVTGAPHQYELDLAEKLIATIPSMEQVRFVNSGTEAVMSAIRLARGFTGKDVVVMFEGAYHGHSDAVLASVSHRSSAGIPAATASNTIVVPYNDERSLEQLLASRSDIACVLIEPVCGSIGVVPPEPGYLNRVSELCRNHDVLLIFDEVLTGLRVARGGAQALYGICPDLTCLGKALGGGMPVGAYGGRREIMQRLEPVGDVYQAGTFSGNPVTMAAGIKTLDLLSDPAVYDLLEQRTAHLFQLLEEPVRSRPVAVQLQRVGSMFSILFCDRPVKNYQDSLCIDSGLFARFFHLILDSGIYFPPSSVDAACVCTAHSPQDIESTARIILQALEQI